MLMIRYSASQHGQLKRTGSDLLIVKRTTAPEGGTATKASLLAKMRNGAACKMTALSHLRFLGQVPKPIYTILFFADKNLF